jgi:hypothetical protein
MKTFFISVLVFFFSCFEIFAQAGTDSLPESTIDIPLQINLRPIYQLAERNVDTLFTSPNYPNDWVQSDCATRYKYHFRRSPFQMAVSGNTLDLSFTGFYKIIGSTRACVRGTVVSPWTPSCRCGFDEPERRVQIGFQTSFRLLPNHILQTQIIRKEPRALDKCTVCFWGQDVTTSVIGGLRSELDLSKKAMQDSFGAFNLRPYLQKAWDQLNATYNIPGVGFFQLRPKRLRMANLNAKNDLLNITIGITASPLVSFVKPADLTSAVPVLATNPPKEGFSIYLDAALQYDSLSRILNGYLAGKRFDVSEGLFKKHIIIQEAMVSGNENGLMMVRLDFIGSFNGTVFFTGTPFFNAEKNTIEIKDVEYDLRTKNLLLKTAKWLFNKRIINELNAHTRFDLTEYFKSASLVLNDWLNREWTKGIKGTGSVEELKLERVNAFEEHLFIRSSCKGKLQVQVTELNLNF